MSNTAGRIYTPKGVLLGYVEIAGTCEPPVCMPKIWKTREELDDNWRRQQDWETCDCDPDAEAVIQEDYGWSQHWWPGKVCTKHMLVKYGHSPAHDTEDRHYRLPFPAPEAS